MMCVESMCCRGFDHESKNKSSIIAIKSNLGPFLSSGNSGISKKHKSLNPFETQFPHLYFFIKFFLIFIFERERDRHTDRTHAGEGQRVRETQNLKQPPGSKLSAQNPMWGLNSRNTRS